MMRCSAWAAVGVLLVVSSPCVVAQNLAANGEFDTDIIGWTPLGADLSAGWSSSDHAADPGSGSLLAVNTAPVAAYLAVVSCVDSIPDGRSYRFTGWIDVPPGQTGYVQLWWYWYDNPSCAGTQIEVGTTPIVMSTDGWEPVGSDWEAAPPGTMSAWLVLGISKTLATPGSFQASYDGLDFRDDGIFGDGFESAGAGAWSATVGVTAAFMDWTTDGS